MNLDGCGGCHSQPAIGGTSPAVNPQVAFANKDGASNRHSVVHHRRRAGARGALRAATRTARPTAACTRCSPSPDAPTAPSGCTLRAAGLRARRWRDRNVIFRIPTPVFGAGLIERSPTARSSPTRRPTPQPEDTRSASAAGRTSCSPVSTISGQPNSNGNDGTIARFGWKAQNKSLLLFSGEAYNVEMGITNELFQTERDETATCQFATRAERHAELRRKRRARRAPRRSRTSPSSCASWRRPRLRPTRREASRSIARGKSAVRKRRLRAVPHADA